MKHLLIRTGSFPSLNHASFVPGPPRVITNGSASQRISLHLAPPASIRRASSESEMVRSDSGFSRLSGFGSRSFTASIPEEQYASGAFDRRNHDGYWRESGFPVKELGFPGGGIGKGVNSGNGGGGDEWSAGKFTGGNADWSKIDAYYQDMLKSNPTNSLLLRNYARFLHEVEGNVVKAEEYYGRAILASPGDGEVLASYGKLIWETQRDEDRAKLYFDQAVRSSPDDSMVLGSYAQFMWEAEDENDDDGGGDCGLHKEYDPPTAMVETF